MKKVYYGKKNDCRLYAIMDDFGIYPADDNDYDLIIYYDSGIYPSIIDISRYICRQVYINDLA